MATKMIICTIPGCLSPFSFRHLNFYTSCCKGVRLGGLRNVHGPGIVHGSIKIVRPFPAFLPRLHIHSRSVTLTNILVDGDGRARVEGLGMVSIRPSTPAVDPDQPPAVQFRE
jgi:hypothetical protein